MSRFLAWTLGLFCLGAVLSVLVVVWLGCGFEQATTLAAVGLVAWILALVTVLVFTILEASAGSWKAGVFGSVALVVGALCLLLDIALYKLSGLCGPWTWNV